jgi:hypothetical protein
VAARKSKHVRRFLTGANRRMEDASFLREADRTLAAAYLAGYSVEFVLKALVLAQYPEHEQPAVVASFRGGRAHDYRWLLAGYRARGGASPPPDVSRALVILDSWGTELRYDPRTEYPADIDEFLGAVDTVMQWATRRL